MEHNGLEYETLSFLRSNFSDPKRGIPELPGIYYFVYWPDFNFETITVNDLEKKLKEFSTKNLQFPETLKGMYKFIAEIKEQKFDKNIDPLLGLSQKQRNKLIRYFSAEPSNIENFHLFFKEICFARPFYIGKANNLRKRLNNYHFKDRTDVIPEIRKQKIPETQVWVGFKHIPMNADDEMNRIFEEIISRNLKPGLTKKPH